MNCSLARRRADVAAATKKTQINQKADKYSESQKQIRGGEDKLVVDTN
jgi:hypothetical protein